MPRPNSKHLRIPENDRRNSDCRRSPCSDAPPLFRELLRPTPSHPLERSKIQSVYRREPQGKSRLSPQDPRPSPAGPEEPARPAHAAIPPYSRTDDLRQTRRDPWTYSTPQIKQTEPLPFPRIFLR